MAIYLALVETCMERPYEIVFRELNKGNERLMREVAARRESEPAKERPASLLPPGRGRGERQLRPLEGLALSYGVP